METYPFTQPITILNVSSPGHSNQSYTEVTIHPHQSVILSKQRYEQLLELNYLWSAGTLAPILSQVNHPNKRFRRHRRNPLFISL